MRNYFPNKDNYIYGKILNDEKVQQEPFSQASFISQNGLELLLIWRISIYISAMSGVISVD